MSIHSVFQGQRGLVFAIFLASLFVNALILTTPLYMTQLFTHVMASGNVATLIALTTFNVIVGELVPKTLALQYPTPVALATVMPMLWSLAVYRPFIGVLNGSGNLVLRIFGVHQSGHRHVHSPEEL